MDAHRQLLGVAASIFLIGCGSAATPQPEGDDRTADGAVEEGGLGGDGDGDSVEMNPDGGNPSRDAGGINSEKLDCDASTIAFEGTIDGNDVKRRYKVSGRLVTDEFSGHELPAWGRLTLSWHKKLEVGQTSGDVDAEVSFPFAEDALLGRAFCSVTATTTRQDSQFEHYIARLAEMKCPGEPVAGQLTVTPEKVTGTVAGVSLDEAINGTLQASGRFRVLAAHDFIVVSDKSELDAKAGSILSGRFALDDGTHYCIGGGKFTRDTSTPESRVSMTLTQLSKVAGCKDLPVVGDLNVCVADHWQLDRP